MKNIIEECAEAVHKAYCENYLKRTGKPYWTGGDYSKLDEKTKGIDRATVRAVLSVIKRRVAKLEKENRRLKEEKNRRIMKAGTMPSKERQKKNLNNNLSEYGM